MAKLPKQWISARAEDGTAYQKQVECYVSAEGKFSIPVDESLMTTVNEMKGDWQRWPDITLEWMGGAKKEYRVAGHNLSKLTDFLKAAAKVSITGQQTIDRVICYGAITKLRFYKTDTGDIVQNGNMAGGSRDNGEWWKSPFNHEVVGHEKENDDGMFSVGFGAAVFDKITTVRSTGSTVRYDRVEEEDSPISQLNSWESGIKPKGHKTKEMAYNEAAAVFFSDLLRAMCRLGLGLNGFLSDEGRLTKAIQERTNIMQIGNTPNESKT